MSKTTSATNPPRVLAIASGGGHWLQLWRVRAAWDGCAVTYATTDRGFWPEVERDARHRAQPMPRMAAIVDANRWQKLRLLRQLAQILLLILRTNPDVIITTGAAPGYFALRIGHLLRKRTVWLDSIANAQELSLSGQRASKYAGLWLTQWEDLASPDGPDYRGAIL